MKLIAMNNFHIYSCCLEFDL